MNSRFSLASLSLWPALALYFALTLSLIAVVPFSAAPDEGAHAQYIESIAKTHALPVFTGQVPPAPGYEFHQPPLYYLLAAPWWSLTQGSVQIFGARALSLLFGCLTIWVAWHAARLVFGRESKAPLLCAWAVALSPLHQGVGASINNDALAGLWAACLFYLVARAWLDEPSKRVVLLTGLVAGLGALTKLTALPLGAWALVCVGLALRKRGLRPVTALAPALGLALLIASPMLVRNQLLYGDPLAYGIFSRAATAGTPGFPLYSAAGVSLFDYAQNMASQIIGTAWGFGGGPNTWANWTGFLSGNGPRLPNPLWAAPMLLVIACPLLGLWLAYRRARDVPRDEASSGRALAWCFAVGAALVVLAWLDFAFNHRSGGQARYLHGALLPLTLLVCGGLSRTRSGIVAAALLGLVMLGMTLANIFVWKTLV